MPAPPNRLFLGVMGIGAECEVGEGKEEKSLGTRQMLCGCTDIFELLSSWRGVSLTSITQLATQCSSPGYLGKVLVNDVCPEKFSQCLIIKGCPIEKVGLTIMNGCLIMMDLCLTMFDRCLIMMNWCLIMMDRCLMIKTNALLWWTCA